MAQKTGPQKQSLVSETLKRRVREEARPEGLPTWPPNRLVMDTSKGKASVRWGMALLLLRTGPGPGTAEDGHLKEEGQRQVGHGPTASTLASPLASTTPRTRRGGGWFSQESRLASRRSIPRSRPAVHHCHHHLTHQYQHNQHPHQ